MVLGGGLEPPRLTAYAPQTYVSAISPPELVQGREMFNTTYRSRKTDYSVGTSFYSSATRPQRVFNGKYSEERSSFQPPAYGTSAVLIPWRDQARSSAFPQSFRGISWVTISFT
jgi:hypothetical protein